MFEWRGGGVVRAVVGQVDFAIDVGLAHDQNRGVDCAALIMQIHSSTRGKNGSVKDRTAAAELQFQLLSIEFGLVDCDSVIDAALRCVVIKSCRSAGVIDTAVAAGSVAGNDDGSSAGGGIRTDRRSALDRHTGFENIYPSAERCAV